LKIEISDDKKIFVLPIYLLAGNMASVSIEENAFAKEVGGLCSIID
jgi:hypothetical protein